jgi:hypothetical protein
MQEQYKVKPSIMIPQDDGLWWIYYCCNLLSKGDVLCAAQNGE